MTKKRILYFSEGWGLGGIESFIMMMVRHLDPARYQCDVYCTHDWSDVYDDELKDLSVHRYVLFHGRKPNLVLRAINSPSAFERVVRNNHYDIVHINTMNASGFLYARKALSAGARCVIVQAHNSSVGSGTGRVKRMIHQFGRRVLQPEDIVRLAVSADAGRFLFGDRSFAEIHNGVDVHKFCFDPDTRSRMRRQLKVSDDTFLFGSVGRLYEEKQPLFQLDILDDLMRRGVRCKLLLVGRGPLDDKITQEAEQRGLIDSLLLFSRGTVEPEHYYCALDACTLPSRYEGGPITMLEAACCGLPILASDTLLNHYPNLDGVTYLPLDSPVAWGRSLEQISVQPYSNERRRTGSDNIRKAGYTDTETVSAIEHYYN